MKIRKSSTVKDEQHAIHVAQTLVVLIDELTLGAPLHFCAAPGMRAGSMGPADSESREWLRRARRYSRNGLENNVFLPARQIAEFFVKFSVLATSASARPIKNQNIMATSAS